MSDSKTIKLGDAIFGDIDNNDYLNELYKNILYNYAITVLQITNIKQLRDVNKEDALRFADLLSKSTHPEKSDRHKIWAQEIITLMMTLYPNDELVLYYAGDVLASTGNFMGQNLIHSGFVEPTAMDAFFSKMSDLYLTIPAEPEKKFFQPQKQMYDRLNEECFSYSAPTSMGKSFVMRMFIKGQIINGERNNYAIIVPTKALINEVRSEIIQKDLKDLLDAKQYHVVSSANDMALEIHPDHNFIFVLTPERLLYLLNGENQIQLDYLFIDEAHKMTGRNSRAPFYYSVVDILSRRNPAPKFIFASPGIPNPEEYLKLVASGQYGKQNALSTTYSPVAQFKFLVNLKNKQIYIYNDHLKTQEYICSINAGVNDGAIPLMYLLDRRSGSTCKMIAYFSGKDSAISAARSFAESRDALNDADLNELAEDVKKQVHGEYFLVELLRKGVAYHIGYLPSAIRMRIEKLFKDGKITAMFCTSTLVEGVNLPADALFVTSYYSGRSQMSNVDFRNLIGRVGRIQYNLSGNVFLISTENKNNKQDVYLDKLKTEIADQKLSLEDELKPKLKKFVLETLLTGDPEIRPYDKTQTPQPEEEYIMMRKFGLQALHDIMVDNDSAVKKEFEKFMKPGDIDTIKSKFNQDIAIIDNDINISIDQTKALHKAIVDDKDFVYPEPVNGRFDTTEVFEFLRKLGDIFNWKRYEYNTLGKSDEDGDYTKLKWYTVILCQWMEGKGLNHIMRQAIQYQERHPDKFWTTRYTKAPYIATLPEHKNIVFANTLEVIENIILFSLSNYFLRFSNEYMKVYGEDSLNTKNWYEYVEYGTTNKITIQLQRYGFSRESATYIREHQDDYIVVTAEDEVKVKNSIENCSDNEVKQQLADIRYNTPELFVD